MSFHFQTFIDELRKRRGSIPADLYSDLVPSLEAALRGAPPVGEPPEEISGTPRSGEPAWLIEARRHIGLKETPGARHNTTIQKWLKMLPGVWWNDDETPWCGIFVAAMLFIAGVRDIPKHHYRAKAWASWGREVSPRVGAVVVFGRQGGGHVGFIVGESATNWYVLGGNQSNQVNIAPIAKSRMVANGIRWPASVPLGEKLPPRMAGGTVSRNEA